MNIENYLLARMATIVVIAEVLCFSTLGALLFKINKCPPVLAFSPVVILLTALALNRAKLEYLVVGNAAYGLYFFFGTFIQLS
jgi:hypothetical protein